MNFPSSRRLAALTLSSLACLLLWDASGLDLALAGWFGTPSGFPLNQHWLFSSVLHEGARRASWLVAFWIIIGVWWPTGMLRRLERAGRVQLAVTTLASLLLISSLKYISTTSCPWDLQQFGGVAAYVSHWRLGVVDSGSGHCFPAGHASAAFAFAGGYFAFRSAPRTANLWLLAVIATGLVLGISQQARGAHYMSHTLWTGWLCWTAAWLADAAVRSLTMRRSLAGGAHAAT